MKLFPPLCIYLVLLDCEALVTKTIQCRSMCHKQKDSIPLHDGRELYCFVSTTEQPPLANKNSIAPQPELITDNMWYVHHNNTIALNITWKQKAWDMYDVRGYYLTVINDEITTRYKVKIRKRGTRQEGVQAWAEVKYDYIAFQFLCHGLTLLDYLEPEEQRRVTIDSIPPADLNHKIGRIATDVKIPKCTDKSGRPLSFIKKTGLVWRQCKEHWSRLEECTKAVTAATNLPVNTTISKRIKRNSSMGIPVVASFMLVTLTISMTVAVIIWKKRKRGLKEILAIADMENSEDVQMYHTTMEIMSQRLGLTMRSNWRDRNDISQIGSLPWFQREIQRADIIIFISLTQINKDQVKKTEFQVFWDHFFNHRHSNQKKSILLQASESKPPNHNRTLRNFRIFLLKNDYTEEDDFFQYVKRLCMTKSHG